MANLFINEQFHSEVVVEDIRDAWPCTWGDNDTAYLHHNTLWWQATPRMVDMGGRNSTGKGHCYWDKVHPGLIPAQLRLYALLLI